MDHGKSSSMVLFEDCVANASHCAAAASVAGIFAPEAAEQVEHPLAPCRDRIVRLQQCEVAYRARPLKAAEHDVVGIERCGAAEEGLRLERRPQRFGGVAKGAYARVAIGAQLLERHAEALRARLAEIFLVARIEMAHDVGRDQGRGAAVLYRVGPAIYEARGRSGGGSAEKRGPVGIRVFEVVGDRPESAI